MKRNKKSLRNWIFTILGIGLVIVGLYIYKNSNCSNEMINIISYGFIGLGCGIFGNNFSSVISKISVKDFEEIEKEIQINENDERNIMISEKSKSKAFDLMNYLFLAMLIIFSLMGIEKTAIIILVVFYLVLQGYAVYWRFKLGRKY